MVTPPRASGRAVVRAVLFDLDDTLVDCRRANVAARLEVGRLAGDRVSVDAEAFAASAREHAERLWRSGPGYALASTLGLDAVEGLWSSFESEGEPLRGWVAGYRHEVWRLALGDYGVRDDRFALELAAGYREIRSSLHALLPDARFVLESLGRRTKLGLVTNGPSDLQREKLDVLGLSEAFGAVAVSGELGVAKPDARIFRTALDRLRVSPSEAAMVGDSASADIAGGRAAGLLTVQVGSAEDGQAACVSLETIRDLPGALREHLR